MKMEMPEPFGSQPRYVQLARTLMDEIISGQYPVGSFLPTELDLCEQFGVSRFTMRAAIKQLVQQGMVVRQRGVGTHVRSSTPVSHYAQFMSGIRDLHQYTSDTSLHIEHSEVIEVSGVLAQTLGVSAGETWLHVQGRRFAKGSDDPICYTEIFIAPRFRSVKGLAGHMACPVYEHLEEQFNANIATVEQEIRASTLSASIAYQLGVSAHSPALWLARRYLDQRGELAEYAISHHPEGRFSYRQTFQRDWVVPA